MKKSGGAILLIAFLSSAVLAEPIADPDARYRQAYAPLWEDTPAENVDSILAAYADVDGGEHGL